jgi:type II secretory pathway pseudopilin PulG
MKTAVQRSPLHSHPAFTLVEVMIVVVFIGLLALIAIPAFQRIHRASLATRIVNDIRIFAQSFEAYSMQNGSWPASSTGGAIPAGMTGDFHGDAWQRTTPIGGNWEWENAGTFTAAMAINGFTPDDALLTVIDTKIDDGDLTVGRFQKVGTRAYYVLQP